MPLAKPKNNSKANRNAVDDKATTIETGSPIAPTTTSAIPNPATVKAVPAKPPQNRTVGASRGWGGARSCCQGSREVDDVRRQYLRAWKI
jgi:hypothetical protein